MAAKEDLRVQRTRKLLSDTLLDMMETESIEHISVMDLCNLAMINRGTFYKHFEDKYALLGFALEELKRDLYADFSKNNSYEDTPQAAVRSFFATAIRFFFGNSHRIANVIKNNMCGKVITAIEVYRNVSQQSDTQVYRQIHLKNSVAYHIAVFGGRACNNRPMVYRQR